METGETGIGSDSVPGITQSKVKELLPAEGMKELKDAITSELFNLNGTMQIRVTQICIIK